MTHPLVVLQAGLVAAWRGAGLAVFDAPPAGQAPPYMTIARHDVLPRDGDTTPGYEHRLLLLVWADGASRKAAISLAGTAVDVALGAALDGGLRVTLRRQDRTDTAIDAVTGRARAAVSMTFYTEPDA
jgi:hypothetical protein